LNTRTCTESRPLRHSDVQRVDSSDACSNNFYVPLEILMTGLITLSKLQHIRYRIPHAIHNFYKA
jgi:hypothetical protein